MRVDECFVKCLAKVNSLDFEQPNFRTVSFDDDPIMHNNAFGKLNKVTFSQTATDFESVLVDGILHPRVFT